MKYYYGAIGAQVWCEDCEWKTQSYNNAQAIAKIHARTYGHKVVGELTISFSYNAQEDGSRKKKVKEKGAKTQ